MWPRSTKPRLIVIFSDSAALVGRWRAVPGVMLPSYHHLCGWFWDGFLFGLSILRDRAAWITGGGSCTKRAVSPHPIGAVSYLFDSDLSRERRVIRATPPCRRASATNQAHSAPQGRCFCRGFVP